MIKTITAKINNQVIYFTTTDGINWRVSGVAPSLSGTYDVEIIVTDESGITTVYNTLDPQLLESLKLYVLTRDKAELIKYLPEFLREFTEFKELFKAEDSEFDMLSPSVDNIFSESTIKYCSENSIKEWEQALGIKPNGTLEQRRLFLLAMLRGQGKLNEAKIASIVEAFTGGDAITSFANSVITVKVLPPNNGEIYLFPDVERALKPLIPTHLGLIVMRFYSTWSDIKLNITSWESVSQTADWQAVKSYIPPQ